MSAAALGTERFVLTVVFSTILHGVVLLGVGFAAPDPGPATPTLDVMLVATATRDAPERADFLANANQEGGGDLEEKARPTAPLSAPVMRPEPGQAEIRQTVGAPRSEPARNVPLLATRAEQNRQTPIQTQLEQPERALPEADQPNERELEMARLAAERAAAVQAYAKRPRRKFISAQTREYAYAAYMRAWVARVERIGTANYPPEGLKLHGELILTVAINRDGSIESIDIVKPSGVRIFDDAAIQTVRMSAPFNALPEDNTERVDILHITRTWQYLPGGVLRHR